jgi:(5-formylfuran-3-yl)methyl phosphate synthase
MTAFLASVVDAAEAGLALECGADIIDCTDPGRGALGAPAPDAVARIAARIAGARPVSAAAGAPDIAAAQLGPAVASMRAAGADIVKIGLLAGANARETIAALAPVARETNLVGVFFADRAPQFDLVADLAAAGFAGAMLDTIDKTHGRFLETLEATDAVRFIEACRSVGLVSGVAGSLEQPDVPRLVALDPDFLGFRGALCGAGNRSNALDRDAVSGIRALIDAGNRHDAQADECDRIFVRDFMIDASVGVYNYEKGQTQRMRFNVEADVPRASRVADDFRDVVSYDVFIDAIRVTVQSGHVKLVETMVEEVAAAALRDRRVKRVRVRAEKLDIIEGSVGVEIERRQGSEPPRSPALARLFRK